MALNLEALEEVRAILWHLRDGVTSSRTTMTIEGEVCRPVHFRVAEVPNLLDRLRVRIQDLSTEIARLEKEGTGR